MDVQIRAATEADTEGILQCLSAAFAPYRNQYTPEALQDTVLDRNSLKQRMQNMHILVACLRDEIIGTIAGAVEPKGEGHLRGMAVLACFNRTGVAEKLLYAIENWLRDQECSVVTLDTTEPLLAAMKFYEKHGYRRSGRIFNFFGMPLREYMKELRS